jgi:hypothetical protein
VLLIHNVAHFLFCLVPPIFLLKLGAAAIRSRSAQITVLVPPEDPKIVKGNTSIEEIVTTEDREIELECISMGGKPAAEVSYISNFNVNVCMCKFVFCSVLFCSQDTKSHYH